MRIKSITIINRAPFEKLELKFEDERICAISGLNGTGKTTVLSYIVDSFYELAKKAYYQEFEGREGKFYRVSSSINIVNEERPSIVYIQYINDNELYEYLDIQGNCEKEQLNSLLAENTRINANDVINALNKDEVIKRWSLSDKKNIEKIFSENLLTSFPAYRYEKPSYLNSPYEIKLSFSEKTRFNGYLINPIEVTSDLEGILNWVMDLVLDSNLSQKNNSKIWIESDGKLETIKKILNYMLKPKFKKDVILGIGPRNFGATRIQIMDNERQTLYPSVFGMSSGELAIFSMFVELLKQADMLGRSAREIEGIVIIDEVDKHLHMILQKDVVPEIMKLFPKIQFIVSTHSPFFNIGLKDCFDESYVLFDMDKAGIACGPEYSEVFKELYEYIVEENKKFLDKYEQISNQLTTVTKPLIITEGKTDWRHIKTAIIRLGISDFEGEFLEYDDAMGDETLYKLLEQIARIKPQRKIIGVFDRDNDKLLSKLEYQNSKYHSFGNEMVLGVILPIKNKELYGEKISIEHYYKPEHLKKEDNLGRRLFLGEEFYESGNSIDGKYQTKCKDVAYKVKNNGVIDSKVFLSSDLAQKNSIAMSKSRFAELVYNEDDYSRDFEFSAFLELINTLKSLCSKN